MNAQNSCAAVIFDLDGTLIDTADDLAASMNFALGEMGLTPVAPGAVRHLVGSGARAMLARGIELASGKPAGPAATARGLTDFLAHYENHIAIHSRPFDGVLAMIDSLREQGIKMAICTNKREAMARHLLDTMGLSARFETIIGADTASAPKPDAAPVRLCMKRLAAQKAVFVGDSDTDILAAEAAGLPCLVATFGYGPVTLSGPGVMTFAAYDAQIAQQIQEMLAA